MTECACPVQWLLVALGAMAMGALVVFAALALEARRRWRSGADSGEGAP